jgi:hypothetical protein
VLNLFLALLLSSFAGLNESDGEEEGDEPKKTRLQRLVEMAKRIKKKKKSTDENADDDEDIDDDSNEENGDKEMKNGDEKPMTDGSAPEIMVRLRIKVNNVCTKTN